jgi:multiple sugar transport system substrate-binding protein
VAEHFYRPDDDLLGTVELMSPAWGWINFLMRFVSTRNPVQYYFDDNMKPLLDTPQGVRALRSYVDIKKFHSPNALSWIWSHEYEAMGAGRAVMCTNFPNVTKFVTPGSPLDKGFGTRLTTQPVPGFKVGNTIVRHPSVYFNNTLGVNAFAPRETHAVSYLLLQWLSSGQILTWLGANPGGYQDPSVVASFSDPLVEKTYGRATLDAVRKSVPAMAPPVASIKGASEYTQVLDVNLQKALSGQASVEGTLEAISSGWDKVTNKHGRASQAAAWRASKAAWPKRPGL